VCVCERERERERKDSKTDCGCYPMIYSLMQQVWEKALHGVNVGCQAINDTIRGRQQFQVQKSGYTTYCIYWILVGRTTMVLH